jgi:hypothetical protein
VSFLLHVTARRLRVGSAREWSVWVARWGGVFTRVSVTSRIIERRVASVERRRLLFGSRVLPTCLVR